MNQCGNGHSEHGRDRFGKLPKMKLLLAGCAVLSFGLTGCSDGSSTAADLTTTTSEPTTSTAPATSAPPPTTAETAPPPPASAPEQGVVPNVVGQDHQFAQDSMQAAGFYNLTEEDASGQERSLVFDRNWKVCSQSPPGGTTASSDTTVILRSVKDEESCP